MIIQKNNYRNMKKKLETILVLNNNLNYMQNTFNLNQMKLIMNIYSKKINGK